MVDDAHEAAGTVSDRARLTDEELEEIKRLAFIAGGRIAPLCHRLIAEVERLRNG